LDGFSFEDCALDAHDEEAPEAELIVSDVKDVNAGFKDVILAAV